MNTGEAKPKGISSSRAFHALRFTWSVIVRFGLRRTLQPGSEKAPARKSIVTDRPRESQILRPPALRRRRRGRLLLGLAQMLE
jgi:hypothetical protein